MVATGAKRPEKSSTEKAEDKEAAAAKLKNGTAAIALEEDDDFEDFPADDWEQTEEEQLDSHQWEDTWADDDEGEDLAVQLESETEKRNGPQPMKM
ncbi:hypothetical protein BDZ88DRAFT_415314 [Geranomyces variabilis]|nr:hypothetical protein BDZ88DRAFT_415314 [Geranomyces variabilis]KAJ3137506.1 hypothetical protein HDU90_001909 [Geranomyces variabilis]